MIDMKKINNLSGIDIYELEINDYEGKYNLTTLETEGSVYRFSKWLNKNHISEESVDETPDDVYENSSGARNGNRIDFYDHYELFYTDYEITGLYSFNGTVWAIVYNRKTDEFYGQIEILPV